MLPYWDHHPQCLRNGINLNFFEAPLGHRYGSAIYPGPQAFSVAARLFKLELLTLNPDEEVLSGNDFQ